MALLSNDSNATQFPAVVSSEYRLRATVIEAPHGDFMACMEMAKVRIIQPCYVLFLLFFG